MITQVTGENIKGLSFVQDLDQTTLLLGNNGTGKSARIQALVLALTGYIPGGGKTNAEILASYGSGDRLVVGVRIDGRLFERGFVRKGKTVSQGFKVGGRPAKADEFSIALGQAGAPKAVNVADFVSLSDQKKIDVVFDLYPPEADVSKIVRKIEETKARINTLTAKAAAKEAAAATLVAARAEMKLPPGTLAEVYFAVKDAEGQLAGARQQLLDAEIEEAREKGAAQEKENAEKALKEAAEKAEKDARRKLLREQAAQLRSTEAPTPPGPMERKVDEMFGPDHSLTGPTSGRTDTDRLGVAGTSAAVGASGRVDANVPGVVGVAGGVPDGRADAETSSPTGQAVAGPPSTPQGFHVSRDECAASPDKTVQSIQAILKAIGDAGCQACAARLVAVREMKKFREGAI